MNRKMIAIGLVTLVTQVALGAGINPPRTGPVGRPGVGIKPPVVPQAPQAGPGIGNFMQAQIEVAKLREITGDDLAEHEEALIAVAQRERRTTALFAEWNEYYRSENFARSSKQNRTMELIALKMALHHIAVSGTGREMWGEGRPN